MLLFIYIKLNNVALFSFLRKLNVSDIIFQLNTSYREKPLKRLKQWQNGATFSSRHYHHHFLNNSLVHSWKISLERRSSNGNKSMFYVRVEWFLLARDKNDKRHFCDTQLNTSTVELWHFFSVILMKCFTIYWIHVIAQL